jgi:hypothetical protein
MIIGARAGHVLWCAVLLCCGPGALAVEPQKPAAPPPAGPAADAEFLEFLGADDVEDADWREFLGGMRQEPGKAKPSKPRSADEDDES